MKYYESPAAEKLRAQYPWIETGPALPEMHGWFTDDNARMLLSLPPSTKCILELGAWYGQSTVFMAEHFPDALIVSIDIWDMYPELKENPDWAAKQPDAYQHFLTNVWPARRRIIPIRETTWWGMHVVAAAGVQPDAVYIDADHTESGVMADVAIARRAFPAARLIGDDWGRGSVQRGVVRGLRASGDDAGRITNNGQCWSYDAR